MHPNENEINYNMYLYKWQLLTQPVFFTVSSVWTVVIFLWLQSSCSAPEGPLFCTQSDAVHWWTCTTRDSEASVLARSQKLVGASMVRCCIQVVSCPQIQLLIVFRSIRWLLPPAGNFLLCHVNLGLSWQTPAGSSLPSTLLLIAIQNCCPYAPRQSKQAIWREP